MGLSLVTGGAGFIGQHLVQQLLQKGEKVRVLDISPLTDAFDAQVELIQGSILDEAILEEALKGVNHLYHLAAIPHLWAKDKSSFFQINYEGTKQVLSVAKKLGTQKIVVTSTEAILGGSHHRTSALIDETTPLPTLKEMPGPYTRSKWMADQVSQAQILEGLPIVIVYPTTPVGPGDRNLTPPTQMIRDFLMEKTPAYLNCDFNLIAVEDLALGHILAAEKGKIGERYILGNANIHLGEILAILEKNLGKKMPRMRIPYFVAYTTAQISEFISNYITRKMPIASLEGVRLAGTQLSFDCKKAREELGLPKNDIEQAILSTAHWLLENDYVKK